MTLIDVAETFKAHMDISRRRVGNTHLSVEEQWKTLKESLLEATEISCGWPKGPPRHKETWWWNNAVDIAVKEKRKLRKEWKKGKISKDVYLEAKRKIKRAVYEARSE